MKTKNTEYAIELYNKDSMKFINQYDIFYTIEDAEKTCNKLNDELIKNNNQDVCYLIEVIYYDDFENEICTERLY